MINNKTNIYIYTHTSEVISKLTKKIINYCEKLLCVKSYSWPVVYFWYTLHHVSYSMTRFFKSRYHGSLTHIICSLRNIINFNILDLKTNVITFKHNNNDNNLFNMTLM